MHRINLYPFALPDILAQHLGIASKVPLRGIDLTQLRCVLDERVVWRDPAAARTQ